MKTLLVHPQFSKIGGAEKVALKILELLITEFDIDVTILTNTEFDSQKIELQTGIFIDPKKINVQILQLPSVIKNGLFHTKIALLHRKAKELAPQFSYLVSTYNELDFGRKALQYIHHPMLAPNKLLSENHLVTRKKYLLRGAFELYRRANNIVADRSFSNISKNITATNSTFIKNIYKKIYNAESKVIYPSIIDDDIKINKSVQKKRQILTVSRFSPLKNVHSLLRVFDDIHKMSFDFKFVIAGQIEDVDYFNFVKKEALNKEYDVMIVPDCSRNKILSLYNESEYYINPKKHEHFGIAVLEAVKHGCIPLIHASGGSIEIVPEQDVQFLDLLEVPQIVWQIDSQPSIKEQILKSLKNHTSEFSEYRFRTEMHQLISHYIRIVN